MFSFAKMFRHGNITWTLQVLLSDYFLPRFVMWCLKNGGLFDKLLICSSVKGAGVHGEDGSWVLSL